MQLSLTIIIIIVTTLVSIGGFNNHKLLDNLIFYPPAIHQQNQWYRFFTCGFIHADFSHLIFNMIGLYFFGEVVEDAFKQLFAETGGVVYLLLYLSALFFSLLATYLKHRDNYAYRSLGASGAVSAVVFAALILHPGTEVFFFFIPIPIPGFIFAPLYLLLSVVFERRSRDDVNHSAHFWGGVYGAAFVIVSCIAIGYPVIQGFVYDVKYYMQAKGWIH